MSARDGGPAATEMVSRTMMRRGTAGFVALTMAGFGGLYVYGLRGQAEQVALNLSGSFFALALASALFDFYLGGLRHHVFLSRLVPGTRLWLPIRADLVGRFTGAVTPSQTGGGPGQIFMLHRGGMPLEAILSTLTVNLIATLVFFVLMGVPACLALSEHLAAGALRQFVLWGFGAVLGLMVLLVLAVTRPDLAARPIAALARGLEARNGALARHVRRAALALVESVGRYKDSCRRCLEEWPTLPFVAVVLTGVMYLNKFTLGWLVVRGLGFDAPYVLAVVAQAIVHIILYAAPTPGGSGIAELSTGALMSLMLPPAALVPFTLAYRFFLLYLPAAIGASILVHELRPRRARSPRAEARAVTASGVFVVTALAVAAPTAAQLRAPPRMAAVSAEPVSLVSGAAGARVSRAIEVGIVAGTRADSTLAWDLAVQLAAEMVRIAPEDAEAHYLYSVAVGHRLELAGTREKLRLGQLCRDEAERALELDPDHPGALHVLGRLHAATMRLGRVTRFVAQHVLGAGALDGASWDLAEAHFLRAAEVEPDNPRHWMELASLYLDTDREGEAIEALVRAVGSTASTASERQVVARAERTLAGLGCPAC